MMSWRTSAVLAVGAAVFLAAAAVQSMASTRAQAAVAPVAFNLAAQELTKEQSRELFSDVDRRKIREDFVNGLADRLGQSPSEMRANLQGATQSIAQNRNSVSGLTTQQGTHARVAAVIEALADEMNISKGTFANAVGGSLESALRSHLSEAVDDGTITSTQRNAILDRFKEHANRVQNIID
jgi:hypothetical protein